MFRNLFFVLNLINIIFIKSFYSDPIAKGPLVFSDEFNYVGSPDPDKWYAQIDSPTAVISGVSSCATDKNAYVTGGNLTLVVKKENLNGKNYTSGALNSWRGFRYGIFEMRAKLGTGRGTWSNFLLFADQRRSSKWPLDGEIDIAEVIFTNSSKVPSPRPTSGFSVHCDKYSNSAINIQKLKNNTLRTEVSNFGPIDEFNVYTLDWSPERLVFYVNEIEYYRYNNDGTFAGWPFDGSMNVMFNLKLGRAGDTFAGYNGIDDSIFPVYHDIDYIRVYALPGTVVYNQIHWQEIYNGAFYWAAGCDFPGNDLRNETTRVPVTNSCEYKCLVTPECTHFVWKPKTCYLKKGPVTKSNAIVSDPNTVCAINLKKRK